ncbi:hypothetical protein SDJN03_06794, partial [Cucurbita argyrosperma subsp. sororia]
MATPPPFAPSRASFSGHRGRCFSATKLRLFHCKTAVAASGNQFSFRKFTDGAQVHFLLHSISKHFHNFRLRIGIHDHIHYNYLGMWWTGKWRRAEKLLRKPVFFVHPVHTLPAWEVANADLLVGLLHTGGTFGLAQRYRRSLRTQIHTVFLPLFSNPKPQRIGNRDAADDDDDTDADILASPIPPCP